MTGRTAVMIAATAMAMAANAAAPASGEPALVLAQGSRLWLEGNSTLHRYKAEASGLRVTATLAPNAATRSLEELAIAGQLQSLQLTVPVRKLTSGESALDKNLWNALKAAANPDIVFTMDSYTTAPAAGGQSLTVSVHGRLAIAGVEKAVDFDLHAFRAGSGLRLIGSKELAMSDFSVTAPVLMGGMIRTDDKVVVRFDVRLQPA